MNKLTKTLWLFIPVILAVILRANHLLATFPFTMDESYQAYLALNMSQTGHIPLIGVNIANTGLYLAPLFTYLSFLLYTMSGGSPISTAIASVFLGGITTASLVWVSFKLAKLYKLHSPILTAFMAGLFYAVTPLMVALDKKFWNPSLLPLMGVWGLYSLSLIDQKKSKGILILSVLTGLAWHTHVSFLAFSLTGFTLALYRKIKISRQDRLFSLGSILLLISPLIIFDLRHEFIQLKGFSKFLSNPSLSSSASHSNLWSFLQRLVWNNQNDIYLLINACQEISQDITTNIPLIIWLLITLIAFKHRKEISKRLNFLLLPLITFGLASIFLKPNFPEYYFLSLTPLIIFLISYLITLKSSKLIIGLSILYAFTLANQSLQLTNSYGLQTKINLINKTQIIVKDQPYQLDAIGSCSKYQGYGYLFTHYFKAPVKSYMDPYFNWLYLTSDLQPRMKVVVNPGPSVTINQL